MNPAGAVTQQHTGALMSFIAYHDAGGAVWVSELHVDSRRRRRGVATWLVNAALAGEPRQVELQVRSGDGGAGTRQAYTSMGMTRLKGRERSRVFTAARDGFEIMKTDEMRVRSRWRVDGEVREYVGWGAVPDEVAECMIERVCEANAGVEGYTADDARESLRGRMEESVRYKMVIHVGDVRADGVGGAAAPPSPSPLHTHTHMAGADKRRTVRRPTTSRWSAGSLAEMQRHMAGRGGGDGVT